MVAAGEVNSGVPSNGALNLVVLAVVMVIMVLEARVLEETQPSSIHQVKANPGGAGYGNDGGDDTGGEVTMAVEAVALMEPEVLAGQSYVKVVLAPLRIQLGGQAGGVRKYIRKCSLIRTGSGGYFGGAGGGGAWTGSGSVTPTLVLVE